MSRRRAAAPSHGSRTAVVLLLLAVAGLSGVLWRIYPEYQRLKNPAARGTTTSSRPAPSPQPPTPKPKATASLYFARVVNGEQRLVGIERRLPPGLGVARAAIQELIAGAVPEGCERPLPDGTKLLGITVVDGLATADFSGELVSGFRGGSDNEGVTVYSIVDTLTSLPTVERVRILVNGKPVSSIGGHLDLSAPLRFDGELVVE